MNLDALKKVIREELRTVMQDELKEILVEAVKIASTPEVKSFGTAYPTTVSTENLNPTPMKRYIPETISFTGNPLLDLLNETASDGEWRSMNGDGYNASDAVSWAGGMPGGQTQVVGTVDEMISKNKHAQDISQVNIDAVPDFSKIMSKMKENGTI
tara:strand:+ start:2369 stop:2836 length:468 start_codon:yes stop_codon:yes gene_type:complete